MSSTTRKPPAKAVAAPPRAAAPRLLPLLLIGLALVGAAWEVRSSSQVREYFLRNKDLPELEAAARAQPQDALAHYYLAKSYYLNRRFSEAQAAYEKAARLDPDSARACLGLGLALYEQGKTEQARNQFARAIRLDDRLAWAEYMLGKLLWAEGKAADALPHVRRATELDPRSDQAWYGLAACSAQMRRYPEAIAALRKAVERNPASARYHTALGELLVYRGQPDEGLRHYEQALQHDPNFGPACALAGGYYLNKASGPEAQARAETLLLRATELKTPRAAGVHFDLGQLYIRKRDYPQAIAALRRSLELDPRDERAYYALANAYRRAGNARQADATEATFRRISALHIRMQNLEARLTHAPRNAPVRLELARVYRELGLSEKAAQQYMTYLQQHQDDAVIREAEQFLKRLPDTPKTQPDFSLPALP